MPYTDKKRENARLGEPCQLTTPTEEREHRLFPKTHIRENEEGARLERGEAQRASPLLTKRRDCQNRLVSQLQR